MLHRHRVPRHRLRCAHVAMGFHLTADTTTLLLPRRRLCMHRLHPVSLVVFQLQRRRHQLILAVLRPCTIYFHVTLQLVMETEQQQLY